MATADSITAGQFISWGDTHLALRLSVPEDGPVTLDRIAAGGERDGADRAPGMPVVELSYDGEGRVDESPSSQHLCKAGTGRLRYAAHEATTTPAGRDRLTVIQRDEAKGLSVASVFERIASGALTTWTEVSNDGTDAVLLDFVSSLCATNFARGRHGEFAVSTSVYYAHNAWATEMRWRKASCQDVGIVDMGAAAPSRWKRSTRGRFALHSTGSWSTGEFLPMGALEDATTGQCWVWQLESNGGWHWEIGDHWGNLYLLASGPTDQEHQWRHRLAPGERLVSVPAAVAVSSDGFEGALAALTHHRRAVRRPNADNSTLPVVFNDYMNCLMGDPTTAKLLPLIDAAAEAGAEYFVIDAGWYAGTEIWWDSVGSWEPSATRFPGGLGEVVERIRDRGMRPGLWLEPEMVGVRSPIARSLPDRAFFSRNGRRVTENGRHQLDLHHPAARHHLDTRVDRLIEAFGIEYFKFDYNVNIGVGTDTDASSPGDGLLRHNRALLAWLDALFARYPDLVVENCAAGGMRMDYAQLSRLSIQSTSDQQDPVHYATIAASAPAALTPEQSAVWAYPQPHYDDELNTFTLVNALLQRVHLSGRIDLLDARQLRQVRDALEVYKQIRPAIAASVPHWPLGLPAWTADWTALALQSSDTALLAVWRCRGAETDAQLHLPWWTADELHVDVLHPTGLACDWGWDPDAKRLVMHLPHAPSARLLELRPEASAERTTTTGSNSHA